MELDILSQCSGFEWGEGNSEKNWIKHGVHQSEAEQVFFNYPMVVGEDPTHSQLESRYFALGHTNENRKLLVVFTIRDNRIRVISARDMNRSERRIYDEKKDPEIQ